GRPPAREEVVRGVACESLEGRPLVTEVQVERTGGDVGGACHLGGRGGIVAADAEDLERRVEEPRLGLPPPPRRAPVRRARGHDAIRRTILRLPALVSPSVRVPSSAPPSPTIRAPSPSSSSMSTQAA